MTDRIRPVRSALFVPGSKPERFDKALATGADRVIVDFEDAVEEALKAEARNHLENYLASRPQTQVVVRVNAVDHPQHQADVAFCKATPGVCAVMLPKVESSEQLRSLQSLQKPLWPLIESAQGILIMTELARVSRVERLTFGALDLGVDLGITIGSNAANKVLDNVRYSLILASVSAGLAKPLDTVFADISDLQGLQQMARDGRNMGFGGMLCIHPTQVAAVELIYAPSEAEIEWARKVLAAAAMKTAGAFRLEGRMVDAPVILQAKRLIAEL
ncbi:Citrate lyase subunit beta-like protein [Pseudomonas sp. AD21]|uniref:HpcH/HpaI aldolase/citrate lyase family protein n=1 Tax=Pseudomonas sp. AD21 TaxID=396378 RepID=UPI000C85A28E|nr:CoA ester lyase [Pseudomonas sp. AD21]PMQ11590.1 Citrate lyase subunit beta-like protein [Pseudomonas sp. AD21]